MSLARSARRLRALVRRNCGQIFAQRQCPIRIWGATLLVTPPKVVVERVLAGLEARGCVARPAYGGFGECEKDRADPAARARRRDIQRRDAISVHFYPADGSPFHGHPHVMLPHRPRHAICCPSRGPSFGLFPRHRWYSQRDNGPTPYTCERFLISGLGAPNLHQVASGPGLCRDLRGQLPDNGGSALRPRPRGLERGGGLQHGEIRKAAPDDLQPDR